MFWLIIFFCFLPGCIPVQEHSSKPLIINVLDKALYDDCHIPGSIHIPFNQVEQYVQKEKKDKEIIIYCSNYTCTTSHYVAEKLHTLDFINVKVYAGGMAEWYQYGLPVEGPSQKEYLTKYIEPTVTFTDKNDSMIISVQELAQKLDIKMVPKGNPMAA